MKRRIFFWLFAPKPNTVVLFDNWVPVPFSGRVNGTNPTFTLAAGVWRKIEVYLNGQFCYQSNEVGLANPHNYVWLSAEHPQVVRFVSPIPQVVTGAGPDQIFIRGTL
jgi:hypothetical protein